MFNVCRLSDGITRKAWFMGAPQWLWPSESESWVDIDVGRVKRVGFDGAPRQRPSTPPTPWGSSKLKPTEVFNHCAWKIVPYMRNVSYNIA